MLGEQSYQKLQDQVIAAVGKDKAITEAFETTKKRYPTLQGKAFNREVIARLTDSPNVTKQSWWQDVKNAVNKFLWDLGLRKKVTDQDVLGMIRASFKRVMTEEGPPMSREDMVMANLSDDQKATVSKYDEQSPEYGSMLPTHIFIRSASDKLREIGLPQIGNALDNFYDRFAELKGRANGDLLRIRDERKKLNKAQHKTLDAQRQRLGELLFDNRLKEAEALLKSSSALAKEFGIQKKMLNDFASTMEEAGVQVKDRTGKNVPFKRIPNYMPGILKDKYADALANPSAKSSQPVLKEMAEILYRRKRIKDNTTEAVLQFVQEHRLNPHTRKTHVFGNIEKSRTNASPDRDWETS